MKTEIFPCVKISIIEKSINFTKPPLANIRITLAYEYEGLHLVSWKLISPHYYIQP